MRLRDRMTFHAAASDSCGRNSLTVTAARAASTTCGRNSLAVTVTVLAVTVLADCPQCGYGRMVKKALRSYTSSSFFSTLEFAAAAVSNVISGATFAQSVLRVPCDASAELRTFQWRKRIFTKVHSRKEYYRVICTVTQNLLLTFIMDLAHMLLVGNQ